jgi:SAM-dependent methyltransferase
MTTPQDALALHSAGRTADALIQLFNAIGGAPSQDPAVAEHRLVLASLLEGVALTSGNAVVFHGLLELLRDPQVDPQAVARAVLGLLSSHGAYTALESMRDTAAEHLDETFCAAAIAALFGEALVREALPRIVVSDARTERVFTFVRRALLRLMSDGNDAAPLGQAASLLALAAANGEYAWREEPWEREMITALAAEIDDSLAADGRDPSPQSARALLLVLLYRHASSLRHGARLADIPHSRWGAPWSALLAPLLQRQVNEWSAQRAAGAALPALAGVPDATSAAVQSMYEAHPYPRWTTVSKPLVTNIPAFVRVMSGRSVAPDSHRVLIAGCGTGRQAAHTALSFPHASILAIDLSRASLGYAAYQTGQLGISNVEFMQGDILHLHTLQEQFALVFCSGVLHHMADPMEGWHQLVRRLHPRGLMKVALYSTLARQSVRAARALIGEGPMHASDDDVRAARELLMALPPEHAAKPVTESTDFHSLSGCRDLVMHVQERTYTIPELAESLDALGLRFLGFQLPMTVQHAFTKMFPRKSSAKDLDSWARFEEQHPLTFWGMYQCFVEHRHN